MESVKPSLLIDMENCSVYYIYFEAFQFLRFRKSKVLYLYLYYPLLMLLFVSLLNIVALYNHLQNTV